MVVARIVVVVRAIIVECGQRCDGGDSYSGPVMSHISKQKKRKKGKKKRKQVACTCLGPSDVGGVKNGCVRPYNWGTEGLLVNRRKI